MFTWGKLICIEFLSCIKKKINFKFRLDCELRPDRTIYSHCWSFKPSTSTTHGETIRLEITPPSSSSMSRSLSHSLSLSLSLCVLTDAVSAFLLLESSSSSPILCRWWTARTARLPYLLLLSTTARTARLPYLLLLSTSLLSLSTTHACSQALLKFDGDLFFYLNHFLMGQLLYFFFLIHKWLTIQMGIRKERRSFYLVSFVYWICCDHNICLKIDLCHDFNGIEITPKKENIGLSIMFWI